MTRRVLPAIPFWALGVSSLVWAFFDPRFRDTEGFLLGEFGIAIAIGIALLVIGWTVSGRFRVFGLWLALALVGQAMALQMIDAGSALRYQHYKPFERLLLEAHPLLLIYLAFQTVVVAIGIFARRRPIWNWLRSNFRVWQLLIIALVFLVPSATLSPQIRTYLTELVFAAFVQTINLGNIVLVAWAFPREALPAIRRRFEKLFGPFEEAEENSEPGLPDRFAVLVAAWVVIVAIALNIFVYESHPHVPDEVADLYRARYMASGVMTLPAPPVPEAFELYLMHVEAERWYPSPPPGWPAMLSVGVLVRAPWLVNPALAGLNILLIYVLLRELYSRRTARIAVLLLAVSPWYIFLGMSFMTHMFTLATALVAAIGVSWARRTGQARWAWIGGLALGMMSLTRPLEALSVAFLLGLWAIGVGGGRLKFSATTGLVVGSILVAALVFPYNKVLTGEATVFPIMAYTDQYFGVNSNAMGFGPDRGMGWRIDPNPGHDPLDAAINANLNTFSINVEMFGWSIGSLLIASVFVFAGRLRRSDYLMLALVIVIFWAHIFYYFSGGPDFGARYWFLMIVPGVALTARGIQFLGKKLASGSLNYASTVTLVMVTVLALSALTLATFFPWRSVDKYHHFRGMRSDIRQIAREYDFGRSLVLIRGDLRSDYASAAAYNPLDLQADAPIYVWDRNREVRAKILQAYPERPVWIVEGPSITQVGYKVTEGPILARELLSEQKALLKATP